MHWKNLGIGTKLMVIGLTLVVLTLLVSMGETLRSGRKILKVADQESTTLAFSDLTHIAQNVRTMVEVENDLILRAANSNMNVAMDYFNKAGEISFAQESVTWNAANQLNNQSTQVSLPRFLVGGVWLGQNREFSTPSPVVDGVKKILGGTATIFQRMNDAGDMLRVCTNVENVNGQRAIGTYIPAIQPNGSPNPVVSTVLRGQRFSGRAQVVNKWYFTAYEPLYDRSNRVIGMLYIGLEHSTLDFLRKKIMDIKVGATGYVYVLDSKGNYIISKNGERDNENILEDKSSDGKYPIKEIIAKALALGPEEMGEHRYFWLNPGEKEPRMKVAQFTYFQPWDWVIGVGAYEDEFWQASKRINSEWRRAMVEMGLIFLLVAAIAIPFIWFVIARGITKALAQSVQLAQDIASGDLRKQVEISGEDELGKLGKAVNHMAQNLKNIIAKISSSSSSVASAADEISATSDQITKGAQSQASAADETSASMEEMAANIQSVAKIASGLASNVDETTSSIQQMGTTAEGVAKNADSMASNVAETSSTIEQMVVTLEKTTKNIERADGLSQQASKEAKEGGEAVMLTVAGMKKVSEMMATISGVIQNLDKRSEAIGSIIEVIEEIADQTNLLALNAAIEAARAGDAGRGFAVVADEVRKLAERSIKATKEIGEVIKQVQKDTESAVQVTEQGANSSKEGITLADQAGAAIARITEAVNSTSRIMRDIASATSEQSIAAKNVIRAVEEMNRLTQSVNHSTKEQALGTRQVIKAAENMTQMTEQVKNATEEQKKGGESVVKAIENISEIAKANLAGVEQLSSSARDLAKQSEGLQELVRQFKVA